MNWIEIFVCNVLKRRVVFSNKKAQWVNWAFNMIHSEEIHIKFNGVDDGTRTHDKQNHNLSLYQLNYDHHKIIAAHLYKKMGQVVNTKLNDTVFSFDEYCFVP